MKNVCIGIPCYSSVAHETLEDYMRFAYHLGRRMPEYNFFLAIKPKSEQFRARNAIVTAAMQMNCDYLFMIDDDHVIDWKDTQGPNSRYDFLSKLISHMEDDPKIGIAGALYYHRGGDCLPVVMKEGKDGGYYYMRDDEITHGLQEVAVQGGGAMLCRMDTLLRIQQPIFEPEFKYGTDIQVCQKVRDAGFRVMCDTSIVLGHVLNRREIVTPETRTRIMAESSSGGGDRSQFDYVWQTSSAYHMFYLDALEHLGFNTMEDVTSLAMQYEKMAHDFPGRDGDLEEYYRTRGKTQLARQVWFHGSKTGISNDGLILSLFGDGSKLLYGLDWACGSSPVGFELALRGYKMDFVDVDGGGAYEFVKWRAKKRDIEKRCGWEIAGPYDFILAMDALEHFPDATEKAKMLCSLLKENGVLMTNYFMLNDVENVEHISMDRESVQKAMVESGVYPVNQVLWVKRNLGFMDKKE
jgi:hypothetical protein